MPCSDPKGAQEFWPEIVSKNPALRYFQGGENPRPREQNCLVEIFLRFLTARAAFGYNQSCFMGWSRI